MIVMIEYHVYIRITIASLQLPVQLLAVYLVEPSSSLYRRFAYPSNAISSPCRKAEILSTSYIFGM